MNLVKKLISAFLILSVNATTFFNASGQPNSESNVDSVKKNEIKKEIVKLREITVEKINNDVDLIADGFTASKQIIGRLRWAYSFKSVLDAVTGAFSITASVTDIKQFKQVLEKAKSPLEWASLLLILNNTKDNADNIAFVFNGTSFVAGVEKMLETADSTQNWLKFDSIQYRSSIEQSIFGFNGQNIVTSLHKNPLQVCSSSQSDKALFKRIGVFKNVDEVRSYLNKEINNLEKEIDKNNYNDLQMASLINLVKEINTVLLRSKLYSTSINLELPKDLTPSNCKPSITSISLGRITAQQEKLTKSYEALDKDLALEQISTLKSAADGVTSATQVYLAGKKDFKSQKKVLDTVSKLSLSADIGIWSYQKMFTSDPKKIIVETPQFMMMDITEETSNMVLLIDTLKSIFSFVAVNSKPPIQPPITIPTTPTLFLFDVSGSMSENNKIEQARAAGLDALREIRESSKSSPSPVSIMTFSGDNCNGNVTRNLLSFTTNLTEAEAVMKYKIPNPNGATPLPQALQTSINTLNDYLSYNSANKQGRIVVLSDGQSTCGEIRPAGTYSRRMDININTFEKVKFLAVGFDIPPGSPAERDLQYLASVSGGKYFNAADRRQLIRAFQKLVRVYVPKSGKYASNPSFSAGINAFIKSDYLSALKYFRAYTETNNTDPFGWYNLALAYEALDRYNSAIDCYRKYISVFPNAPDRSQVEANINRLRRDRVDIFNYYVAVIRSDLDYLKTFYSSVFRRGSNELAVEFKGFVNEKQDFYKNLYDILEINERWLINDSKDISDSLDNLSERTGRANFDQDAVSLLTVPIAQLEELIEKLDTFGTQNIR